jgi:ubiquinone/menaquinone biosynthesis C-methylase UbiE
MDISGLTGGSKNMRLASLIAVAPVTVVPSFYAQVAIPGSPEYQEASVLLVKGFARARQPRSHISYLDTLSTEHIIVLVVRQRDAAQPDPVVGTVLLELPSGASDDQFVQFRPGSLAAESYARGTCAEIRGLVIDGLSPQDTQDALDTLGLMMVTAAREAGLKWLWMQCRIPLIAILLAEVPQLLPPYRFAFCQDVVGWYEGSPILEKLRALHLKEMPIDENEAPVIYSITPDMLAEDVARRLALLEQRHQRQDLPELVSRATRQALRHLHEQHAHLLKAQKPQENALVESTSGTRQPAPSLPSVTPKFSPEFLRQVVELGGEEVARYKNLSYKLLQLGPGMQVLDVGCGPGVDLLPLAKKVGKQGQVTGLDNDRELLREGQQALSKYGKIHLVEGLAEQLPFLDEIFDRTRADRVLQHVPRPKAVLAEMWRVLRPGGRVVLVEPDWKTAAIYPGSPEGGDDDRTLSAVLAYNQRQSVHPLIGRQLRSLFWEDGVSSWEDLHIQSLALSHTSWPVTDALLTITQLALGLSQESPALASEITAWLKAIERAADWGEFMASIQFFFASARKPNV